MPPLHGIFADIYSSSSPRRDDDVSCLFAGTPAVHFVTVIIGDVLALSSQYLSVLIGVVRARGRPGLAALQAIILLRHHDARFLIRRQPATMLLARLACLMVIATSAASMP